MIFKTLGIFFILVMGATFSFGGQKIKEPNVSGQFYPDNPGLLSSQIDQYFSKADVSIFNRSIDIVIAPHAGYIYSGPVAAYGFKSVSKREYSTVVILAPSHFVDFDGISLWPEGGFRTPLGVVEVDKDFVQRLIVQHEKFYFYPQAFEGEHSLEVEIPFLQKTFQNFKIVPVIFGQPSFEILKDFSKALNQIIGDRKDVLVLVSTDMSHYHTDEYARKMDNNTLEAIKGLQVEQIWKEFHLRTMEMCGWIPLTAALLYAQERGLNRVEVLRYANSGDITGERNRVVGYSSVVIYKDQAGDDFFIQESPSSKDNFFSLGPQEGTGALSLSQKKRLLEIARKSIKEYILKGRKLTVIENDPRLKEEEGAFVTIHKNGDLRGCIGHVLGRGPLSLTVRDMAIAAATEDPRFRPLQKEELDQIDLEISVLSQPREIKNSNEIQLGVHGVIIHRGARQGLFLPQVAAETGWSKEKFLSELCTQKAGLPADCWKDSQTKIEVFTAEVFSEKADSP